MCLSLSLPLCWHLILYNHRTFIKNYEIILFKTCIFHSCPLQSIPHSHQSDLSDITSGDAIGLLKMLHYLPFVIQIITKLLTMNHAFLVHVCPHIFSWSSLFPALERHCASFSLTILFKLAHHIRAFALPFTWNVLSPTSSGSWLLLEQVSRKRFFMTTLSKAAPLVTVTSPALFAYFIYCYLCLCIVHSHESRALPILCPY